jgi:hypothetical protein
MKPQTPAQGILKLNDYGECIWYQVSCECTDPDHAHLVEVEADDIGVTVHIYANVTTPWWSKSRWKQIWQILTRGYAETEIVTILKPQQAINYANVLLTAVENVNKMRKKK